MTPQTRTQRQASAKKAAATRKRNSARQSGENAKASVVSSSQAPFVIAHSMREVQPEINILVSPIPERLFAYVPDGAPTWTLPVGADDG